LLASSNSGISQLLGNEEREPEDEWKRHKQSPPGIPAASGSRGEEEFEKSHSRII
jgi:hypothetical protein